MNTFIEDKFTVNGVNKDGKYFKKGNWLKSQFLELMPFLKFMKYR